MFCILLWLHNTRIKTQNSTLKIIQYKIASMYLKNVTKHNTNIRYTLLLDRVEKGFLNPVFIHIPPSHPTQLTTESSPSSTFLLDVD